MERELAALLSADVVGDSRLSQLAEEASRTPLLAHLKAIRQTKIAHHDSRLMKPMGDGCWSNYPAS